MSPPCPQLHRPLCHSVSAPSMSTNPHQLSQLSCHKPPAAPWDSFVRDLSFKIKSNLIEIFLMGLLFGAWPHPKCPQSSPLHLPQVALCPSTPCSRVFYPPSFVTTNQTLLSFPHKFVFSDNIVCIFICLWYLPLLGQKLHRVKIHVYFLQCCN